MPLKHLNHSIIIYTFHMLQLKQQHKESDYSTPNYTFLSQAILTNFLMS